MLDLNRVDRSRVEGVRSRIVGWQHVKIVGKIETYCSDHVGDCYDANYNQLDLHQVRLLESSYEFSWSRGFVEITLLSIYNSPEPDCS